MIERKWDWPEILSNEIAKARALPFEFGEHDCCMFSNNLVLAYTGTDIGKELRGYSTVMGSIRVLKKKGKGTLLATMNHLMKIHDCPRATHVALLRRGDICMAKVDAPNGRREWAVGICVGMEAAFASDGVAMVSMDKIDRGWHCG